MITIRLMRFGATKRPSYRIVVMDSRKARQGKALDTIGFYSPLKDPIEVNIDAEKAEYWLKRGAQASQTVRSLLDKVNKKKKLSDQGS